MVRTEGQVLRKEGNNTQTILWHLEGHQSDKWLKGYAPSEPSSSSIQIAFQGTTGTGKTGLIAISGVRILPGRTCWMNPLTADPRNQSLKFIPCSFDDLDFCHWTQPPDSLEWKFGNATSKGNLLPKPRQPLKSNGNFIFISSYENMRQKSRPAKLTSPIISSFVPDSFCFSLYYHMFGPSVTELRLLVVVQVYDKEERQIIWKRKRSHPDQWLLLQHTINAVTNRNFRIQIEAEGGNGFSGHIAIDEISVSAGQCADTEMFVYADLTSPSVTPGKKAVLVSEVMEAPAHLSSCLSFEYVIEGSDLPTFTVGMMVIDPTKEDLTYKLKPITSPLARTGMRWTGKYIQIPLSRSEKYWLYFQVVKGRGQRAFVSFHDVSIEEGWCIGPGIVTPTLPTKEPGTTIRTTCPYGKFRCSNGNCILSAYVCNGYNDCGDRSDERNCRTTTVSGTTEASDCPSDSFLCSNGHCIRSRYQCNGLDDCGDGSDEEDCNTSRTEIKKCRPGRFKLWDGRCIDLMRVYDGKEDWSDGSHEIHCDECPKFATVLGGVGGGCLLLITIVVLTVRLRKRKLKPKTAAKSQPPAFIIPRENVPNRRRVPAY